LAEESLTDGRSLFAELKNNAKLLAATVPTSDVVPWSQVSDPPVDVPTPTETFPGVLMFPLLSSVAVADGVFTTVPEFEVTSASTVIVPVVVTVPVPVTV
jgi:hypothetical protein